MKEIKESFKEIAKKHHGLFWGMILLFVSSLGLLITSVVTLNPSVSVANVGYGDIGGYRTGSWANMLTFAVFAIIIGVLHNFLVIRIFSKRGEGLARVLILFSMLLVISAFIVLIRLLGEG